MWAACLKLHVLIVAGTRNTVDKLFKRQNMDYLGCLKLHAI